MGLGVLDVLGSIGSGITTATQRNSLTRTQRRQEEEARKRQLLAGLPQEVRMAVTEKSMTRPDSDFEAIISESIQEFKDKEQQTEISRINKAQRDAEILEEQSATDAFIEGTQGRSFAPITTILGEEPGRPVTKEEATALATAGQQGQGLDVLTQINKARRDAVRIAVDTKLQTEVRDIRKSAEKPSVDFDALIGRAKAILAFDVVQELEEMKENRAALKGNDKDANGVKLGEVAQRRVNGANTFLSSQKLLIPLLEDENIAKMVGPAAGRWNRSKQGGAGAYFVAADEFIGQYTGTDLVDDVPPEFTQVQGLLVNMADAFLRMRTGAAANNDEVKRVSREIMGDISLTAPQIITMMKTLAVLSRTERDVILSGKELDAASIDLAESELRAVISTIKRDKRKKQQKVDKEQAKAEAEEKKRLEAELEELNERERSFEE